MFPALWGSKEGFAMKIVRDILNVKGTDVWRVEPDATVFDALQLMAEKEVGALVVTENDKVVGIISERDIIRALAKDGHNCL